MGWKSAGGKVVEAVVVEIVKASEDRLEARIEQQAIASEKRLAAQFERIRESNTAQHNELHASIDSVKGVLEVAAKTAAAAAEEFRAVRLQLARLECILLGKGDAEPQD